MASNIVSLMIELTIQSSLIIAVVLVLRVLFGDKLDKRVRYYLWIPVIVRLLIPVSIGSRISVMNLFKLGSSVAVNNQGKSGTYSMLRTAAHNVAQGHYHSGSFTISWQMIVLAVWIFGALLVLAFTLWGNARFAMALRKDRREVEVEEIKDICRKLRIRHTPKIYVSDITDSPCAVGIFRSAVYLPEWALESSSDLTFILTHELTHIKQKDNLYALFVSVCCVVYWFDPLVWIMGSVSRNDREPACDANVIAGMDDQEKTRYGMAIVSAVRRQTGKGTNSYAAAFASDSRKGMVNRVKYIKSNRPCAKSLTVAVCAVMIVAVAAFGTSAKTASATKTQVKSRSALAIVTSSVYGKIAPEIKLSENLYDPDIAEQMRKCFVPDSEWTMVEPGEEPKGSDEYYQVTVCGDDNSPGHGTIYFVNESDGKGYLYPIQQYGSYSNECVRMSDSDFAKFKELVLQLKQ